MHKIILFVLILIIFFPLHSLSQNVGVDRPFVYFPRALPEYQFNSALGITIARLPRPIVEEELDQSPLLDFNFRLGLPYNFSISSRINTIAITNHISAGFEWSSSIDKFSLSIGNQTAYWFGWANFYDFDVRVNGVISYPQISFGYDFDNLLLTLRLEAEYLFSMNKYSGNIQTTTNRSRMIGFSSGLIAEQIFWKQNWITIGFKMRYTRYFYQGWISFSTLDQWFWVPEIVLSYNL